MKMSMARMVVSGVTVGALLLTGVAVGAQVSASEAVRPAVASSDNGVDTAFEGPWRTLSSKAGSYRVEAKCPRGMTPLKGSVEMQEFDSKTREYTTLEFPARHRGGSIGQTLRGSTYYIYANLELDAGVKLRARAIAHCS